MTTLKNSKRKLLANPAVRAEYEALTLEAQLSGQAPILRSPIGAKDVDPRHKAEDDDWRRAGETGLRSRGTWRRGRRHHAVGFRRSYALNKSI